MWVRIPPSAQIHRLASTPKFGVGAQTTFCPPRVKTESLILLGAKEIFFISFVAVPQSRDCFLLHLSNF